MSTFRWIVLVLLITASAIPSSTFSNLKDTRLTFKVIVDERFDFSLPELTGCSRGFHLVQPFPARDNQDWLMITDNNTLSGIPTPDDVGPHAVPIACTHEILVEEFRTKTITLPNGEIKLISYTVTRPIYETSVHNIYLSVQPIPGAK